MEDKCFVCHDTIDLLIPSPCECRTLKCHKECLVSWIKSRNHIHCGACTKPYKVKTQVNMDKWRILRLVWILFCVLPMHVVASYAIFNNSMFPERFLHFRNWCFYIETAQFAREWVDAFLFRCNGGGVSIVYTNFFKSLFLQFSAVFHVEVLTMGVTNEGNFSFGMYYIILYKILYIAFNLTGDPDFSLFGFLKEIGQNWVNNIYIMCTSVEYML